MEFKQITDYDVARYIFTQGYLTGDRNSKNHSVKQFDKGMKEWLGFFVLYDGDDPVLFTTIRKFGKYARIFDRYMVFPEYRSNGLGDNQWNQTIINPILDHVGDHIPFFSIERVNRRGSIAKATRSINEVLPQSKQFHVLDGMYETVHNSKQHISIQKPHTIINLLEI
tara:strand:- start:266 stop:769 length:504 start_codon:yes stop_codon:yes gene_type:complete